MMLTIAHNENTIIFTILSNTTTSTPEFIYKKKIITPEGRPGVFNFQPFAEPCEEKRAQDIPNLTTFSDSRGKVRPRE